MRVTPRIALIAVVSFAACSPSTPTPDTTTSAVAAATVSMPDAITALDAAQRSGLLAFRDSVWHAWFAGDTAFLRQALPADFLSIPYGDDTTWAGRDQTIADAAGFAASGGKLVTLEFPRSEVQVVGNAAIVLTTYRMELENGGKRSTNAGRATEIFVRQGGRWLHPSWHLDSGR